MRTAVRFGGMALTLGVLAGCGGGGSTAGAGSAVAGKVTTRNGAATALGGIVVTCVETGEVDVTTSAGTFHFDVPAGVPITLAVDDPVVPLPVDVADCHEDDDATGDGMDRTGGTVEVEALEDGETCTVEIDVSGGDVVGCWVGRGHHDGHEDEAGETLLVPNVLLAPDARGECEVHAEHGCTTLEIEVEGLPGPQTLDVFLTTASGRTSIGRLEVQADGAGHFESRTCDPAPLPIPLPAGGALAASLEGVLVELCDASGATLLAGVLPAPEMDDDEDGDDGEEDGEDGEHHGGGTLPPLPDGIGLPGFPLPDDFDFDFDFPLPPGFPSH